jgi:TonB family protein
MWPGAISRVATMLATFTVLLTPQLSNAAQHHGAITGDLAEALGAIAVQMRVPIVAELALPLPNGFNVPDGDETAEKLLNSIIAASPGYSWKWVGRIAHIYNRRLLTAPSNFLNFDLESLLLPSNVAEFSVTVRNALWQCSIPKRIADHRQCPAPIGGVIGGLWPTALEPLRLTPKRIGATSARQVMLEVANDSGRFYSIVVFPRPNARTPQDAEFAFYHWAWHPLSDPAKPFPSPFSWYGRIFRVQPDVLLQNLITPVAISRSSPNAMLRVTVDERGRMEQVSILEGSPISASAIQSVRSWRFKPYHLNGLPAKLMCDLPVEVIAGLSVHPTATFRQ